MKTLNQLAGDNASFTTGVGAWVATGATLANDTSIKLLDDLHTLVITPSNANNPVTVELSNISIPITYSGQTIQFHTRLKCSNKLAAVVEFIHNQTMPATYQQTRNTSVPSNLWTVCRSNMLPVPNVGVSVSATVSIEISGHNGSAISMTLPFLYGTFDVDDSLFTLATYAQIPQFFRTSELIAIQDGIMPESPTLRLIECGLSAADDAFDDYYRIEYVDIEDAGQLTYTPSPSLLVSPLGVNDATAPWLAQFLGFSLDSPQQQTTPWGGIPGRWFEVMTAIDTANPPASPTSLVRSSGVVTATFASTSLSVGNVVSVVAVDGSSTSFSGTFTLTGATGTTATWAQSGADETASETHSVAVTDTNWSELEDSNPDVFDRAGYNAWQLENAYAGLRAGSLNALTNAAKLNLSGDKIVTVQKRYSDNPWRILVKTKTSETPNGEDSVESEIILNAIKSVKPLGYKVEHLCTPNGT